MRASPDDATAGDERTSENNPDMEIDDQEETRAELNNESRDGDQDQEEDMTREDQERFVSGNLAALQEQKRRHLQQEDWAERIQDVLSDPRNEDLDGRIFLEQPAGQDQDTSASRQFGLDFPYCHLRTMMSVKGFWGVLFSIERAIHFQLVDRPILSEKLLQEYLKVTREKGTPHQNAGNERQASELLGMVLDRVRGNGGAHLQLGVLDWAAKPAPTISLYDEKGKTGREPKTEVL